MDKPAVPEFPTPTPEPNSDLGEVLRANVISDALDPSAPGQDDERRRRLGLPVTADEPVSMMIELNLLFPTGLAEARRTLKELIARVLADEQRRERASTSADAPTPDAADVAESIGDNYVRVRMTLEQVQEVGRRDAIEAAQRAERAERARAEIDAQAPPTTGRSSKRSSRGAAPRATGSSARRYQSIYRVWPDFIVRRQIDMSASTVKGDAARRSFDATGDGIAWAVVDSGVDATHAHFRTYDTLGGGVAEMHYDFTQPEIPDGATGPAREEQVRLRREGALVDTVGHGTHVAGIIAGALVKPLDALTPVSPIRADDVLVVRGVQSAANASMSGGLEPRIVADLSRLSGIAPRTKIVSLKVLTGGADTSSNVIRALHYIRETLNGNGKIMRVHGANLSLGYEFDPKWFACGQSPICVEVDRLVRSGVVVVVAAGNTGYGRLASISGQTGAGLTLTINDPGNAALAITVGATHRESPHTFGVSYFSSKGPTGDGRLKPDLVAPGERITSCAAGKSLEKMLAMPGVTSNPLVPYIEDSGTSMAAPHVSGAAASFLSIRREFIGKPEEIKRIFLQTATSLGRERYFEGHGLVDLMRAIQSV